MLSTLPIAVFGVLAASVLRGFTGFGFGLAAVPLLSLALPPVRAVPFVVVLQVIVGAISVHSAWRLCDWRAVRGLAPGLVLGIPVGVVILTVFRPNTVRFVIGLATAASVVVLWRGARLPPRPSPVVTGAVGFASGILSGLSSTGGPPIVVYLLALAHDAAVVRATSIIYFGLAAVVALVPMTWRGLVDRQVLIWAAASIPVLFAGTWMGNWGFRRARPQYHRLTALLLLSVLSLMLIIRAVIAAE